MKKIVLLMILCLVFSGCFKTPQEAFDVHEAAKKSYENFVHNASVHKYKDMEDWAKLKIELIDRDLEIMLNTFEERSKTEKNPAKSMRVWIMEEVALRDEAYKKVYAEVKRRIGEFNKSKEDCYNAQKLLDSLKRYLNKKIISKKEAVKYTETLMKVISKDE